MERLVEQKEASSPAEARLTDLVKAVEPVGVSDSLRQQVFARVLDRPRVSRWGALLLRPAVVFGILLIAGATTAATLGRSWIVEQFRPTAAPTPPAPPYQPAPAATRRPAPIAVPAPAPVAIDPAPVVERTSIRAPHARPAKGEDPSRVVAAIQALRGDGDPERAGKLLAEYLKTYPRGALAEEALALSIEAAAARKSPAAKTFATQYLKEYPNGRFHRTAEQALTRP